MLKNKSLRGMTLVELILVVSIFALVSVGIAASFVSGVKLWNRARNSGIAKYEVPLLFTSIGKELRQGTGLQAADFSGTQEQFTFTSIIGQEAVKLTYTFDPHAKTFTRRSVRVSEVAAGKENMSARERTLMRLDSLTVQYLGLESASGQYLWRDIWLQEQGRWRGIQVHAAAKGKEYDMCVFMP